MAGFEGGDPLIDKRIQIHEKALDDLVNVNSLLTVAVFIGFAFATRGQRSLENRTECDADIGLIGRLVILEVVSFSFFLLSSLTAKILKVHLNIYREDDFKDPPKKYRRWAMMYISAGGSIVGLFCLMLSMVDVVQMRLGKLSCGGRYAWGAVVPLVMIVSSALCIYTGFMAHAIHVSMIKS